MKRNILLLVPSLCLGGQERVAVNTAQLLKETDNISFAVFTKEEAVYAPEVPVIDLNLPAQGGGMGQIWQALRRARVLKKLKRELSIDVTLSFGMSANLANVLSRVKDRVIVSVHGYSSVPRGFMSKLVAQLTYRGADLVSCVSKELSDVLSKHCKIPKDKMRVLYNPYDVKSIFERAHEDTPFQIQYPAIVSVGRMQPIKGYRHLLRAFCLAREKMPALTLVLVGDGAELSTLQMYAKELGIAEHVLFTGFQENPYAIVARCDLFVLSSISEGFPNALVEAMACGMPVLAADCKTGPREILTRDYVPKVITNVEFAEFGVLFPPFEEDFSDEPARDRLLANTIVELLEDKALRESYGKVAMTRVAEFSFEMYRRELQKQLQR